MSKITKMEELLAKAEVKKKEAVTAYEKAVKLEESGASDLDIWRAYRAAAQLEWSAANAMRLLLDCVADEPEASPIDPNLEEEEEDDSFWG